MSGPAAADSATPLSDLLLEPAVAESAALCGLVVAAVFTVAGTVKLAAPASTAEDFGRLGLPRPDALARVVPVGELLTAGALIVVPGLGGPTAAAALGAFTAVLVRALQSGRQVSCGCLGALDRGPISRLTVVRNLGLMALTLLVTVQAGAAGPARFGLHLPSPVLLMAAGAAATAVAVSAQMLALRRTIGRIWSVRLAGEPDRHPIGDEPDADTGPTVDLSGDNPSLPRQPAPLEVSTR